MPSDFSCTLIQLRTGRRPQLFSLVSRSSDSHYWLCHSMQIRYLFIAEKRYAWVTLCFQRFSGKLHTAHWCPSLPAPNQPEELSTAGHVSVDIFNFCQVYLRSTLLSVWKLSADFWDEFFPHIVTCELVQSGHAQPCLIEFKWQ